MGTRSYEIRMRPFGVLLWAQPVEGEPMPLDKPCYRVLHGRDAPCLECPALAPLRPGHTRVGVIVSGRGEPEIVSAQSVAKDAVRLTSRPIDDDLFAELVEAKLVEHAGRASLTQRELEVLHLLTLGRAPADVARALGFSVSTAKFHVQNVLRKLGAESRVDLLRVLVHGRGRSEPSEGPASESRRRVGEAVTLGNRARRGGSGHGRAGGRRGRGRQRRRAGGEPRSADERLASLALFAGGVAHDLNNMLAVTLSLCEALARDERLGETARESVDAIRESTRRATDLVRRLLALGRGAPQARSSVDVNATVADVSRLVARVLGEDVRVEIDLCPGLPAVHADATQLEQAVMNLMLNSRAAMRDGGTIRVSTARRDAARGFDGAEIDGPCVAVAVSDTGTGMPPEVLARVFEPFFSARPGGGLGLGLSSVHRWLRDGGGVIDVESHPGRGTTFTLALPLPPRDP